MIQKTFTYRLRSKNHTGTSACARTIMGDKKLERRAIVHNFHSQVCKTLHKLDVEPDLIVALDSHLDWFWGVKNIVESMPKRIRLAASRASAHTLIRRAVGDLPILLKVEGRPIDFLPEMILVIPQISLNHYVLEHVKEIQQLILGGAISPDQIGNPLESFLNYLSSFLGIGVFTSPPKNLMKLVDMLREAEFPLLDLDVDYLQELQTECYTPIKYAHPGQLGWAAQTLRVIRKTKPPLITISEVKVAATQEPNSSFSKLVSRLKNWGYKIEYKLIFDNDEEAERLIKIYQEFYEGVQKPLERKHRMEPDYLSKEALGRYLKELKEATKRYFRQRSI